MSHAERVLAYGSFEALRCLRSRQYLFLAIALPAGLYVATLAAGTGGPGGTPADGATRSAASLAAFATLGALGAGLVAGGSRLAAERDGGWLRTLSLAALPRFHMLAGRVLAGIIAAVLSIAVVVGAGAVGMGLTVPGAGFAPGRWLALAVSLWAGAVPFALLGVVVGLTLGRRVAVVAVLILYVGLAVGGGLLEPGGSLPADLATMERVLPSFVADDLGWRVLLGEGLSARDIALLAAESLALGSFLAWTRRRP